ncbi:MAG: DUF1524 domain-containing protein [Rhodococcus sp.]|nr:DUF1524 domain-containing protein [Rhodococcus sp. (in: high G+C Gram-positive bacteria)]
MVALTGCTDSDELASVAESAPAAAVTTATGTTSTVVPTSGAPEPGTTLQLAVSPGVESGSSAEAALAQLNSLAIKGRAPKTGYDRDLFGQSWTDDVDVAGGHNGCDTRNDILQRDLVDITFKPGSGDCAVQTGTLHDSYTATTIPFVRGANTSSEVQIDHVVALSDAWQKGAQQLDTRTRENFANDPRNLRAVDGPANQQKSDSDAASWLPPNKSYRCEYVAAQVDVKAAYNLWVTPAEHDAIERVLTNCGDMPAPPPPATTAHTPAPTPVAEPAPVIDEAPLGPFPNCAAARAAGAAPVYAGSPGYSRKIDGDGDGVGCE